MLCSCRLSRHPKSAANVKNSDDVKVDDATLTQNWRNKHPSGCRSSKHVQTPPPNNVTTCAQRSLSHEDNGRTTRTRPVISCRRNSRKKDVTTDFPTTVCFEARGGRRRSFSSASCDCVARSNGAVILYRSSPWRWLRITARLVGGRSRRRNSRNSSAPSRALKCATWGWSTARIACRSFRTDKRRVDRRCECACACAGWSRGRSACRSCRMDTATGWIGNVTFWLFVFELKQKQANVLHRLAMVGLSTTTACCQHLPFTTSTFLLLTYHSWRNNHRSRTRNRIPFYTLHCINCFLYVYFSAHGFPLPWSRRTLQSATTQFRSEILFSKKRCNKILPRKTWGLMKTYDEKLPFKQTTFWL